MLLLLLLLMMIMLVFLCGCCFSLELLVVAVVFICYRHTDLHTNIEISDVMLWSRVSTKVFVCDMMMCFCFFVVVLLLLLNATKCDHVSRCEAIVYRQFSCRAEVNAEQKTTITTIIIKTKTKNNKNSTTNKRAKY